MNFVQATGVTIHALISHGIDGVVIAAVGKRTIRYLLRDALNCVVFRFFLLSFPAAVLKGEF